MTGGERENGKNHRSETTLFYLLIFCFYFLLFKLADTVSHLAFDRNCQKKPPSIQNLCIRIMKYLSSVFDKWVIFRLNNFKLTSKKLVSHPSNITHIPHIICWYWLKNPISSIFLQFSWKCAHNPFCILPASGRRIKDQFRLRIHR